MYVPTNDEMLPVAKALAKAAGKTEADWLDFMEAASADLIAKHDSANKADVVEGGEADAAPQSEEAPAGEGEADAAPAQADEPAAKADVAAAEHDPEACKAEDCEKCAAAKADGPPAEVKNKIDAKKEGDEGDEDEEAKKKREDAEAEEAKKADAPMAPELQQGWRAKDGSFHLKKADAIAHNETLATPAEEPSVADKLEGLVGKADKIISGEVEEEPVELVVKTATLAALADPLAKFTAFMDNDLVKSMYDVRHLADVVSSLAGVHSSLAYDAAWRDDETTLPAEIFENLKGLGVNLVSLASEEVKNLIARAAKVQAENGSAEADAALVIEFDDPIMELAVSTLGLEKAALLPEIEPLAKAHIATLAKVDEPGADGLTKVEALEKRATDAEEQLAKVDVLVKDLGERLEKMAGMPREKAPMTRVVEKGEDTGGGLGGFDLAAEMKKMAVEDPGKLVEMAIRAAQSNGTQISLPGGQPK